MTIITKVCHRCGQEKPVEEFYRAKGKPLDRSANCKPCDNERMRQSATAGMARIDPTTTTRRCSVCGEEKPLTDFPRNPQSSSGRDYACKKCAYSRYRDQYLTPEYHKKRKGWELQNRYGLTTEDYERMYATQNGCCAICGRHQPILAVDHNHETGKVRDLLCNTCNRVLGLVKEDEHRLLAFIGYLQKFAE